jgi:leucyl aminopeptidase
MYIDGGVFVKIAVAGVNFNEIQAEVLIVGTYKHPENTTNWSEFVSFYGTSLEKWLKAGDVSTNRKKLTKLPTLQEGKLQRVFFVGLGDRKTLTQDDLRGIFGTVGKELVASKTTNFSIWLDSFINEDIEMHRILPLKESVWDCTKYPIIKHLQTLLIRILIPSNC